MSGKPIPAEKMPRVIGDPLEFSRRGPSPGFGDPEAFRPDGLIEYDGEMPPPTYTTRETHTAAIRVRLRLLTHREMREFAADLFGAYERLHPQVEPTVIKAAIPREALAEVLDRFAHND